jgi:phage gpG-like protein
VIRLQGLTELVGTLNRRGTAVQTATVLATREVTELVEQVAFEHLTRQSHPPHTPTPSRPGDPPATISGALADSLHTEGPAVVGGGVFARVGPTSPYGRIQELGGIAGWGAQLPERPYLWPAVRDSLPAIGFIYREAWTAALTGR